MSSDRDANAAQALEDEGKLRKGPPESRAAIELGTSMLRSNLARSFAELNAATDPAHFGASEVIAMTYFEKLDKAELRELLVKNWMTHDAMWFGHCVQTCGIDTANAINRAAVKSMARIEAKRLKKAFGIEEIRNFEELKRFILGGFEVIRGRFMDFKLSFPEENVMQWEMPSCFAYEGVKSVGVIDHYQCGIFERLDGWLEALGIQYSVTPEVNGCLLHTQGQCMRAYRFAW